MTITIDVEARDGTLFVKSGENVIFFTDADIIKVNSKIVYQNSTHYTAKEAAHVLGISLNVFRNLATRGAIPGYEVINGIGKYNKKEIDYAAEQRN